MADAPSAASDARWDGALSVQDSGEANGEAPRAETARFRSYASENEGDVGEMRYETANAAVDERDWDEEQHDALVQMNDRQREAEGGGEKRETENDVEEEEEEEDDDWMVAHLATLETKRRESTSMQEVEASVRAALSILNQSSDGAGASQQDEDEDDEHEDGEHGEEGEWRRDHGHPYYFDFVQEAMEARWSLGSPNQNLLNEEGEHAFRPAVHEIQECDEEDEEPVDRGGEQEEHADAGTEGNSSSVVVTANNATVDNNDAEAEENHGTAKALEDEAGDNQADDEWQEAYTAKGRVYYYNRRTRESSWNKPAKYRASARPRSPEVGNGAQYRVVARQSLGYHASNNDSSRSLADQRHLFCCFCGSKHEPRQFLAHFRECKSLNFHKKQSSELYLGFQRMLTVLSEDSSLRALHYASSFPDAQPVPLSNSMQDNLLLLRRRQSPQRTQPSVTTSQRPETMRSMTRTDRNSRVRSTNVPVAVSRPHQPRQQKQQRPAQNGSTPTSSANARAKFTGGFPLEVETCRYCGRSFAEGRLAKHEAVCPRVFGNEGSWGRGTPSSAITGTGSSTGQATTSPASKRRSTAYRKLKATKSLTDSHTLEASYKEHQAALVVCPCCKRKFAPSGAQQHIAICKSVQNRPKNPIPLLKDYATAG